MKLLFSAPSGYHVRELVLPLRRHLEADETITHVHILTPAASIAQDIFPDFGKKFLYHAIPKNDRGYKDLLISVKPDVAITNTVGHDKLDEPVLRISNELGINTVTFIASWDNVWKIDRLIASKIPIVVADRLIVWNMMMKEHLLRTFPDIEESRVTVIGAPRLDYFSMKDTIPSKQEVYAKLGFSDITRPFIHIATTELYPVEYIVRTIRNGIDAKQIPHNPYLYASVHPGGSIKKYRELESYGVTVRYSPGRRKDSSIPSFKYAPTEADILSLVGIFTHASVLVNHSSTVALESLIADVPVVNVRYGKRFDWWGWRRSMVYRDFTEHYKDLISYGATSVVHSQSELLTAIEQGMTHPEKLSDHRKTTVQKMITTTDGTASKNVLEFITAL